MLVVGQRFGRLVVVRRVDTTNCRHVVWLCQCDCGATTRVRASNLQSGRTKSCGCLLRETTVERNRTHGRARTLEHRIWCGIKTRCLNPNATHYEDYGGRGITVCERWRDSFAAFYDDVGAAPSPKHTIDRINNDGHYEPGNCRWATRAEQNRNQRPRAAKGASHVAADARA